MSRFLTGALTVAVLYLLAGLAASRPANTSLRAAPARLDRPTQAQPRQRYGRLPLSFEPNQGQADEQVKFLSRGPGYTLFLTPTEAVLALQKGKSKVNSETRKQVAAASGLQPTALALLRMKLVGANPAPQVAGLDELPGKANYFRGNDPSRWRANIPTYARVRYGSVYSGVDLVFYGDQRQLEYDFVVAPGADPKAIRLGFDGAERIRVDTQTGDLILNSNGGEIRFHKPLVYQPPTHHGARTADGAGRRFIDGRYVIRTKSKIEVGFELAGYDASRPLIIDPVLIYSTFLGGSDADIAYGLAIDASGNAYVTGATQSSNFPTATPLQSATGGSSDVFVTKLNAAGSALIYSTYLGGSDFDKGIGIAVDSSGNAYVTGYTTSSNFPTTKGSFQTAYGGNGDAFVAKLDSKGATLLYSSYLGGSGAEFGQGIALDGAGNAYVTGSTQSANFPTKNPLQTQCGGYTVGPPPSCPAPDAFVTEVKADGSGLVYSTYLGGSGSDVAQAVAVDTSGAYVTGHTYSTNFPTAPSGSALQAANGGGADVFVAKLNSAGSALIYSTYLGGSGTDRGFAIAVDTSGNAYVTGDSASTNYPATVGAFQATNNGMADAFVAKLNPTGTAPLVYFTFLGGSDVEQGAGIAVDSSGDAYITGFTRSSNFPVQDALQATPGGGTCGAAPCSDAFVTKLDPTGSGPLLYSTYLGGNGADVGQAIALASGEAYVAGGTASPNFPATAGAFQAVFGGTVTTGDAFVAKVDPSDAAAVSLSPQTVAFGNEGTGYPSAPKAVTLINAGSAALTISSITFAGANAADFSLTSPPATVPPNPPALPACPTSGPVAAASGTCAIYIAFSPAATGARTGTLVITDSASGSPHQVSLTGTGVTPVPVVTFAPATGLTFGSQTVGTSSPPQTVTLTNTGSAPLIISKTAVVGDFTQTNACGAGPTASVTLNAGSSCVFSIVFTPTGAGATARTGSLGFTDNANPTTQTVAFTGTGVAVFSVTPAGPTSSTVTVGSTTTTFTVGAAGPSNLTNGIALACQISSGAACTFNPTSIQPGKTSTLTVGSLSATTANPLNFNVTGTNGQQSASLPLTVVLADFSVSASPGLDNIASGTNATYTVSVAPLNGFKQAVSVSCRTPLPQGASCSVSPASVTLNGSAPSNVVVTVKTTVHSISAPGSGPQPLTPPSTRRIPWLLWLLAFATLAALVATQPWPRSAPSPAFFGPTTRDPRRFSLPRLALGVTLLFTAFWTGCNDFGIGPFSGGTSFTGTPPGNYQIVLDGTFKEPSGLTTSVTRSAAVNLSVS